MTDFTQDYSTSTNGGFQQSTMDSTANQGSGDQQKGNNDDRFLTKIFVGGLSWETTVKDLREYFENYGPVDDCTLKTDPATGRSRGFGFVTFVESGAVDKVLSEPQGHHLHGRKIDPKRAKARGGREPILKVFVGGLDPSVPEQEIRDYFGQFGKVTEVDLPFDKQKNQRRAFAFVSFESEEMVDKVCELPKREGLGSKPVDIKKATPKSEQQGGYGGRGGRGGGRGGYQGGWGAGGGYGGYGQGAGYDYTGYGYGQTGGYGGGYDYTGAGGYGQGYGSYDYGNYGGQGWGGYGYGGNQGGGAGSYGNY